MSEPKERIEQLRQLMKKAGIDVYYIQMSDCHNSEYVAKHFRCIEFVTGFTGSAGHVIITQDDAWLFANRRNLHRSSKKKRISIKICKKSNA